MPEDLITRSSHAPDLPEQLRILIVVPFPPRLAGTHGGAKAVAELLARTAERHCVALVYLRHRGERGPEPELTAHLSRAEEIERTPEPTGARHLLRALSRRFALLAGTPLWVSELSSRRIAATVQGVVDSFRPDLIRLEFPVAAAIAGRSKVPTVLVDHDPLLAEARSATSPRERIELFLDRLAWRRFDCRSRRDANAVVVFTERDRRVVEDAGGARVVVCIPLGIDPLPALDSAGKDASLLFVGNLNHPANREAVSHLTEELMPLIRERRPEAVLTVVGEAHSGGSVPEPTGFIRFTGVVDDVKPYLDDAAVVVAPLRTGGGMRVKVLEALMSGKAVVAYRNAVEGISVETGRELLVARDAGEFVDAVVDLLGDRDRRVHLGGAARNWALAHAGWDAAIDAYDELYRELLQRRD